MLADISKATTLYLTPVLMLTSLFLVLFAYLAPAVMLHSQVSLLTVTPSMVLTQPGSNNAVDGPSMLIGMLGRSPILEWINRNSYNYRVVYQTKQFSNSNLHITLNLPDLQCVPFPPFVVANMNSLDAIDASVFTSNTPSSVLAAPPTAAAVFLAISLAFSFIFLIMFTGISFRHLMGKAGNVWEKPMVQQACAWIGISSFLVGMWYSAGHRCFVLNFVSYRPGSFPHYSYVLWEGGG